MQLRPRQLEVLQSIKTHWEVNVNRQVVNACTSFGKTVCFASMPDYLKLPKKMMVVVDREELAQQSCDKLRKWNTTKSIGLEMAESEADPSSDVIVASIQTLSRSKAKRLLKFNPEDFSAVVIDECHASVAPSYQCLFDHFDFDSHKDRLCCGFTATVNRHDGKGLGAIYDKIVYQYNTWDAIKEGWVCNVKYKRVRSTTGLDSIHVRAGDFAVDELGEAVNTEYRNDLAAKAWLEHGEGRQTVVYAVDIAHAQALAAVFRSYGVKAEAVWGADTDRQEKLQRHRSCEITVLINCSLLIVGYDDPGISCILFARPTKSELIYQQACGRGLRLPEGINNLKEAITAGVTPKKIDCIVIDIVDLCRKHSLISFPSLFGLNKEMEFKGRTLGDILTEVETLRERKPYLDFGKVTDASAITTYADQIDAFKSRSCPEIIQLSEYQWIKTTQGYYVLLLLKNEHVVVHDDLLDKWHVSGTVNDTKIEEEREGFEDAIRYADWLVGELGGKGLRNIARRRAKWRDLLPTQAQLDLAARVKMPVPYVVEDGVKVAAVTRGELHDSLNQFFQSKTEALRNIKRIG